ncbi:MAG: ComF family protein [Shewanella sp.]
MRQSLHYYWRQYWHKFTHTSLVRAVVAPVLASLPNRCLLCHQAIAHPGKGLCGFCLQACLYQHEICLGCGRQLTCSSDFCGSCQCLQPARIVAPMCYHTLLGPWVAAIKYRRQFVAIPPLYKALLIRVNHLIALGYVRPVQALIPVPLHPNRLKARGFNQARVIATELGAISGLPVLTDILVRVRDTLPQAGLDGRQRRHNMQHAFMLKQHPAVFSVALIDDVVTTGETVREIITLLEAEGILVQVWCLARAEAPELSAR